MIIRCEGNYPIETLISRANLRYTDSLVRWLLLFCFALVFAVDAKPPQRLRPKFTAQKTAPRTEIEQKEEKKSEQEETKETKDEPADRGTRIEWFGHSFVYLTSENGIRIAMDPFNDKIKLPFPEKLQADVVLISYESSDRNGAERLYGTPQIFRSIAGLGTNRSCGLFFRGVKTFRDSSRGHELGSNTVYIFELDGVRFCHLGGIGHPLRTSEVDQIGRVDVVFVPVGNKNLSVAQWREMTERLRARWIVPIAYYNQKAGLTGLRRVEKFAEEFVLNKTGRAVLKKNTAIFTFDRETLPDKPTLLILKNP